MIGRRVKRSRRGGFDLRIPERERDILRTLPAQLRSLIEQGDPIEDPALRRLYPAAYLDDPQAATEFDTLVRDDLTAQRIAAIDAMNATIDAERVSEDELVAWVGAINDLRLVLGVRLAVTEESQPADFAGDPERESSYALFAYLGLLLEEIVEALSSG